MPSKEMQASLDRVRDLIERNSINPERNIFHHFCRIHIVSLMAFAKGNAWNGFVENFGEMKTHQDRVLLFLNDDCIMKTIADVLEEFLKDRLMAHKSNCKAREEREKGNISFAAKQYKEAVNQYSLAVTSAVSDVHNPDNEYAMCYANRSAALFHLEMFEECLADLQEAMDNGYPTERRHVLQARKIMCLKALGRDVELADIMSNLKISGNGDMLSISNKQTLEFLKAAASRETAQILNKQKACTPIEITERSPELPGASAAVRLAYSAKKGHYVVAQRDITASEVILLEKPFCCWLKPSLYKEFCCHCMKKLNLYFVPCRQCTAVKYCSKRCADDSWLQYHRIECSHIDLFQLMGSIYQAFKTICIAGLDALVHLSQYEPPTFETATTDYERLFNLVDHADKLGPSIVLIFTTAAVFTTLLAEQLPYMHSTVDKRSLIAAALLKHILQLRTNGLSVVYHDVEAADGHKQLSMDYPNFKRIGSAIYCSASMLNHGCGELLYSIHQGSQLVLKAVDDIKSGEEITFNYDYRYKVSSREERQKALQNGYFFTCDCKHCSDLEEYQGNGWRCQKCSGCAILSEGVTRCVKCKCVQPVAPQVVAQLDVLSRAAQLSYKNENLKAARKALSSCLQLATTHLWRKNHLIGEIHQLLGRCLLRFDELSSALLHWTAAYEVTSSLHGDDNYESISCLINMAMICAKISKQTKERKKSREVIARAKEYYQKAEQIYGRVNRKEYYFLVAKTETTNDLGLVPLIAKLLKLQPFNVNPPVNSAVQFS